MTVVWLRTHHRHCVCISAKSLFVFTKICFHSWGAWTTTLKKMWVVLAATKLWSENVTVGYGVKRGQLHLFIWLFQSCIYVFASNFWAISPRNKILVSHLIVPYDYAFFYLFVKGTYDLCGSCVLIIIYMHLLQI